MYAYQKRLYCVFIIFNFAILQTIVQIAYAQTKVSPTKKRDKRDYLEKDLTYSEEIDEYLEKASSEEDAPSLQVEEDAPSLQERRYAPSLQERRFYDSEEKKFIAEIFKSPSAIEKLTPEERARLVDAINAVSSEEVSNNPLKKAHTNLLAGGVVEANSSEEEEAEDAFERRKWELIKQKKFGRHTEATAKIVNPEEAYINPEEAYTDLLFPEEKMFPEEKTQILFPEEKTQIPSSEEAYTDLLLPEEKTQIPQLPQPLNAVNAEQTNLQVAGGVVDFSEVNENSGTWTFNFAGLVKNTGDIINAVSVPLAFGIVATAAGTLAIWIERFRNARLRGKEKDEATKDEKKGLVETV